MQLGLAFITWLFFPLSQHNNVQRLGGVNFAIWIIILLSLVFDPPLFNSIGQKNNGGVQNQVFLITIFVPPLRGLFFILPSLLYLDVLGGRGGWGSLGSCPPGVFIVAILPSQINSVRVIHCLVRCYGIFLLSFSPYYSQIPSFAYINLLESHGRYRRRVLLLFLYKTHGLCRRRVL